VNFVEPRFVALAGLMPLVLAVTWWLADRARSRALGRLALPETLRRLVLAEAVRVRRLRRLLLALGLMLMAVALARPRWGVSEASFSRTGVDVVLVVDASLSMTAEDMKPSRLARARNLVAELAEALQGHRLGLVSFAGAGYALCPLTLDDRAVLMLLDVVDAANVPKLGTDLGAAIDEAARLFSSRQRKFKVMVLLTDGEDHGGEALAAVRRAREQGIVIHAIGFGSRAGEPIPLHDVAGGISGYRKDVQGRVVLSRLNRELLETIAHQGAGVYQDGSRPDRAVAQVVEALNGMERRDYEALSARRLKERFQLFLGGGLLLLLLEAQLRCWPGRLRKVNP
jgi:Ca-activated chloride channel family protein